MLHIDIGIIINYNTYVFTNKFINYIQHRVLLFKQLVYIIEYNYFITIIQCSNVVTVDKKTKGLVFYRIVLKTAPTAIGMSPTGRQKRDR